MMTILHKLKLSILGPVISRFQKHILTKLIPDEGQWLHWTMLPQWLNRYERRNAGRRFSLAPYITPHLTPTGTPKIISTSGSSRGYSAAESPQKTFGATSLTKSLYDGRTSLSSWYPSSQQSSAANSPPRACTLPGRTPRVDGKEFFCQARSRLSYEQFSAFLATIKDLNAQKQTREETLKKAEEIFGMVNKDLYVYFQRLLNRNMH